MMLPKALYLPGCTSGAFHATGDRQSQRPAAQAFSCAFFHAPYSSNQQFLTEKLVALEIWQSGYIQQMVSINSSCTLIHVKMCLVGTL